MTTTELTILKMECASCAILIEEISEEVDGVSKAEVNARKKTLTIDHESPEHVARVCAVLAEQGFPVEPITNQE